MTATQWLEVLASFSLQVLVVVSICRFITRAVKRSSDHSAIWTTCFFCIVLLAAGGLMLPRLHLVQPWALLEPQTLLTVGTTQGIIGRLLLAVWCIGAAASLIIWILRAYSVRRLLARCEVLSERKARLLFRNARLDERKRPRILVSDEVQSPFCLQLHEPTVVLPHFVLNGNIDDLRHMLMHELEHIKTNHPFHLFLQNVAQVICWFHPLIWNAARQASMAREFSCDDAATAHGTNSAAYLRTLLLIAERAEQRKKIAGIAFGRSPSELVLRAQRLVRAARGGQVQPRFVLPGRKSAMIILFCAASLMTLVTVPLDPLASSRSVWSPWPKWTAETVHCFGYVLRDYEPFDARVQLYELQCNPDAQRPLQENLLVNEL